jgi:hypothetical protein
MVKKEFVCVGLEHQVAKSGEVLYLLNGNLLKSETENEYQVIVDNYIYEQEKRIHLNQYFFIEEKGMRYGYRLVNEKDILSHISRIGSIFRQTELLKSYFALYNAFNFRDDKKGGE